MSGTSVNSPYDRLLSAGVSEHDGYRLLAAERRRILVDVLSDRTAPMDLREVAIATTEREADELPVTENAVERVAITLHHNHLPRLAAAGIIRYDPAIHRIHRVDIDDQS